ncbi:MAG TPA: glycoside hydrolase family 38 C-terminal domain-containing protein [Spirochaetia bacterium]|nr:glycoside hydrolase family 38 C-terminal domain-containing protein [Spirochaetia bacterium]
MSRPDDPNAARRIVLVGNAHIDMIYRWRLNETIGRVVPDTFRGVLDVMDRHPDFTFAQSQFALYETVRLQYPDLWERIRRRIGEGRWIVVGGKWVESDSMLPGGEALIRQFLVGNSFAEEEMGLETIRVAWIPDCFGGHTHTTPQIYHGCGIDFYLFNRGCPDDLRCFWWEAPDGSRVFAYKIPKHYNLQIDETLQEDTAHWSSISGIAEAMVLYGEGDHGGGPRDGDMEAFDRTSNSPTFSPSLEHGSPIDVLERARDARSDWPTLTGDIGIESGTGAHRGAHISQARLKRMSRELEHEILIAERLATFGALSQRKFFFPRFDMRNLWKRFLLHQFHDTLPGTLVGDAVDDVMRDFAAVREEAARLARFGLETIGARIDTRGDGVPVMVVNPSSWSRSDQLEMVVRRPLPERIVQVTDASGADVPFVCDVGASCEHRIRILATDVPPLGFKLYRVHGATDSAAMSEDADGRRAGATSPMSSGLRTGDARAETERYVVEWSAAGVERIYDRELDRELLGDTANTLTLYEESKSSSWHVSLNGKVTALVAVEGPSIVREDPLEIRVRWTERTRDSLFTREMIIASGVSRIDFALTVDWHESDRLLAVRFPTSVRGGQGVYESPYGSIERPADGTFWPMQKWVARESAAAGVAVLNAGLYSSGGIGELIEMALVRGARDMDPRMDEGLHEIRYSICGYDAGQGRTAPVYRSFELSEPLQAAQQTRHSGIVPDWGSYRNDYELRGTYSFAGVDADHTVLTVAKILEGDWNPGAIVVRLYEVDGVSESVTVRLPRTLRSVTELNHIEQPLPGAKELAPSGVSFSFTIGPHEIRTFRVDLAGGEEGG